MASQLISHGASHDPKQSYKYFNATGALDQKRSSISWSNYWLLAKNIVNSLKQISVYPNNMNAKSHHQQKKHPKMLFYV